MRRKLINWFAVLLLLTGAVFIVGVVTGAIIPLFGGIRAERIGAIAFGAAAVAEIILGVTECFVEWASRGKPEHRIDVSGPKRYGNKKHVVNQMLHRMAAPPRSVPIPTPPRGRHR